MGCLLFSLTFYSLPHSSPPELDVIKVTLTVLGEFVSASCSPWQLRALLHCFFVHCSFSHSSPLWPVVLVFEALCSNSPELQVSPSPSNKIWKHLCSVGRGEKSFSDWMSFSVKPGKKCWSYFKIIFQCLPQLVMVMFKVPPFTNLNPLFHSVLFLLCLCTWFC